MSERQPIEDQESAEILDRTDLRRAAHKILWKRMNGSVGASNPFAEADPGDGTLEEMGATATPSRPR